MSTKAIYTSTGIVFDPYDASCLNKLEYKNTIYDKRIRDRVPFGGFIVSDEGRRKYVTYMMNPETLLPIVNNFTIDSVGPPYMGEPLNRRFNMIESIILTDVQYSAIDTVMANNYCTAFFNIPSAFGKTIMSTYLISMIGVKTLILCYSTEILNQWYKTFVNMTDIDPERVTILDASKDLYRASIGTYPSEDKDIYLCTPRLFQSFGSNYGYSNIQKALEGLGVGMKIIDEAHKHIGAIIHINGFSNIGRTYYLSGDFDQGYKAKRPIFRNIFFTVPVIKVNRDILEQLKYINAVIVKFDSNPSAKDLYKIYGRSRLFSNYKYMKYEFEHGLMISILKDLLGTLSNRLEPGEKVLILVNLVKHVDILHKSFSKKFKDRFTCGRYHNEVSREEKDITLSDSTLIISTHQSFEIGVDVKNIRAVINLTSSNYVEDNQSASRARMRTDNKECFYFMFVDMGVPYLAENLKEREDYLLEYKMKSVKEMLV